MEVAGALGAIGIIASFAGIISFAIQLAEVLETTLENAKTADERVQHTVVQLRATANAPMTPKTILSKDLTSSGERVFTDENHGGYYQSRRRAKRRGFRPNIAAPFASMARVIVRTEHHRGTQERRYRAHPSRDSVVRVLCPRNALLWHFTPRKTLPSTLVADLNGLEASPVLILAVAEVARRKRRRAGGNGHGLIGKQGRWVGSSSTTAQGLGTGPRSTDYGFREEKSSGCVSKQCRPVNDPLAPASRERQVIVWFGKDG